MAGTIPKNFDFSIANRRTSNPRELLLTLLRRLLARKAQQR